MLTAAPVVECPILSRTNYPLKVSCTNGTILGSLCTYSCDNGFILQGSSETTCQTSGSWNPSGEGIPVCEGNLHNYLEFYTKPCRSCVVYSPSVNLCGLCIRMQSKYWCPTDVIKFYGWLFLIKSVPLM